MDDALRDLYQQTILEHGRNPHNFGRLDPHSHAAKGSNPMCGDRVEVTLMVEGDRVADIRFEGRGCAISQASASIMTDLVKGRPLAEVRALLDAFTAMATTGEMPGGGLAEDDREAIRLMSGIHAFPMRVKCATLGWRTMEAALDNQPQTTTEAQPGEQEAAR
ncbi:MAG: SUF system NifU family Fe-S cluster assembly protein [Alphaproteobacteria bacterium]|nr:SUF system NifU family Fe-S cluster assembly protein [Alphaproteobacteria bacterium]MDX5370793.1 SUF system NifU family Fe-S cluster assembly protein [Alphaproteobacteria bacterium]MDX5465206.1 SUF system NifU family Fe-S cluster assembly protein [Alphaproteobacteria bacterium]